MAERRDFPRCRRRILVEWTSGGFTYAGFTNDLSPSGIFIFRRISRSSKSSFTLKLALPDGKKIAIRGRMVRAFRVPPQLRRSVPSGFCVRLMDAQEEYFAYLANLFGVRFADDAETAQLPADEEAEVVEPVAACGGDVLT